MTVSFETSYATSPPVASIDAGARRIPIVPESQLRQIAIAEPATGPPLYAAIRPLATDGTFAQRWEVVFYPTPSDAATLAYRYSVSPNPISKDAPYPLGGRQYAELLLQSCLAVAEQREKGVEGVATGRFIERLAAAVNHDVQTAAMTEDGAWPIVGDPTTLEVDRNYLERLVGRHMGYGPAPTAWTYSQAQEVAEAIRAGLRRFYTPPVLPGERFAHQWSFLRPLATLSTASSVATYELPSDFAMLDGPVTFVQDDTVRPWTLEMTSEFRVRSLSALGQADSLPRLAALRVKPSVNGETRWELVLWPTPDDSYTLQYRYKTNPGILVASTSMPVGGEPHAQTIIESCLWAADDLLNVKSMHQARYEERLIASVAHDRMAAAPESLGRNFDTSDGDDSYDYMGWSDNVVTYNGVSY